MTLADVAPTVLAAFSTGAVVGLVVSRRLGRPSDVLMRRIAAQARDGLRVNIAALSRCVPLYEDLRRRDPQIAESVEAGLEEVRAAMLDMQDRAFAFDVVARNGSWRDRARLVAAWTGTVAGAAMPAVRAVPDR